VANGDAIHAKGIFAQISKLRTTDPIALGTNHARTTRRRACDEFNGPRVD
jgi:hypothetical protein